jgi:hypothetical protein
LAYEGIHEGKKKMYLMQKVTWYNRMLTSLQALIIGLSGLECRLDIIASDPVLVPVNSLCACRKGVADHAAGRATTGGRPERHA